MTIQPSGRGPQLVAVYAFFCALTTVAVSLRAYCRAILIRNFALDDYFAVVSWVRREAAANMESGMLTSRFPGSICLALLVRR